MMAQFVANNFTLTNISDSYILDLFKFQYENNTLYQSYVNLLRVAPSKVKSIEDIPFLPIQFFKTHDIKSTNFEPQITFISSGTTGAVTSKHPIKDLEIYKNAFTRGWEQFYNPIEQYCVLGLLPSYLEREGSSLVYMVDNFINKSTHELSDFYLDEHEHLYLLLNELEKDKQPTLLIGVSYALLDFATKFNMQLQYTIVMETGGMKGRRKEITRSEMHHFLKERLGCKTIHSEYGMTELLSQAYSTGHGVFYPSESMKILVRNEDAPQSVSRSGKGLLNIIDCANVYSCAFIATDDIATIQPNGSFEILGRADAADIRGCSLLTIN